MSPLPQLPCAGCGSNETVGESGLLALRYCSLGCLSLSVKRSQLHLSVILTSEVGDIWVKTFAGLAAIAISAFAFFQ